MANAAYPHFFDLLWSGSINIGSDTFKLALLSSAYTFSSSDQFFSALSGVLATATLTGVTSSGGVLAANDTLVTGPIATPINSMVLYKDTGVAGTSPLFLYLDDGAGFGVTESGDVNVVWTKDTTVRIFPLGGKP